jgi:NADH dehydrogenase FAD-containing subunit
MISDDLLPQDKLFVSIPVMFKQYPSANFRFEHATATNLDHAERTIVIKSVPDHAEKVIEYHALIITTGTSTPSPLLGLNSDADRLRQTWAEFRKALPKAKSIIIAGGGPAGIETAGELGEHLNGTSGWFRGKLENPKVQITVVTSGSQILPVLRSSIANKAEGFLAQLGVTVLKGTKIVNVLSPSENTAKTTVTLSDGSVLEAVIYILATGTVPNTTFIDKSLLNLGGWVNVNNTLRAEGAGDRVYAIGDVASNKRPAIHAILSAVPVLCANIKGDLLHASGVDVFGRDRVFVEDTRETQLVPIGRGKGVGAAMGWQIPSFLVWLIKGRDYWLWTTGGLWNGSQWAKES